MNPSQIKHLRLVRRLTVQFVYQQDAQNRHRIFEEDLSDFLTLQTAKITPKIVEDLQNLSTRILVDQALIDQYLQENIKPEWPFQRMARMDLAILRVGCAELLWNSHTPVQVIISEAVLLADDFCEENSVGYINGLLSAIAKKVRKGASPDVSPTE